MADVEDSKKEEKKDEKASSGRWWEFYFVRYALGTVFGVLIVDFLASNGLPIPFPTGEIKEITKPDSLPLLVTYGLAFCYLASSPLLLFHATRFDMHRKGIRKGTVVILAASGGAAVAWACAIHDAKISLGLHVMGGVAICLISCVLLFQFRAMHAGENKTDAMWSFYRRLDLNRRVKANRELVDSYRHLREHGNAFSVVLLEMLLGLGLYLSSKVSFIPPGLISDCTSKGIACDPTSSPAIIQPFILILLWIMPGAYVWCIGCYLERQFSDDSTMGESSKATTTSP